jgi:hypothetical protein
MCRMLKPFSILASYDRVPKWNVNRVNVPYRCDVEDQARPDSLAGYQLEGIPTI